MNEKNYGNIVKNYDKMSPNPQTRLKQNYSQKNECYVVTRIFLKKKRPKKKIRNTREMF